MAGFRAQQAKLTTPDMSSFAARCGADSLTSRIKSLTRVRDFVALAREHPDITVEIRCGSNVPLFLATTTLQKSKLQPAAQKHLWSFMNGRGPKSVELTGLYAPVSHTVPMYEYAGECQSVLFVTPDASLRKTSPVNCCLPEFLDTTIRRVCGPAFEGLNKTTSLLIPSEPHVVGLGTSKKDPTGRLYSSVELRINGNSVTLSYL